MAMAVAKEAYDQDTALRERLDVLADLERRVLWLSTWMIHHANAVRPSRDGLKVGGHQASSASLATLLTALYFHALRPQDRVAVKPHASPIFHAIQYLLGRQTREQLIDFRAFGGAQSYPSRTKDSVEVDFSTGSVGLGVAATLFASLVQDMVTARNLAAPGYRPGRMIALMGDAELDEGNIFEARRAQPVVDRRLQSSEPRRRHQRPARAEIPEPVRELRLADDNAQVWWQARGGAPRTGGRGTARLDRQLPKPALFRPRIQGRGGMARAAEDRSLRHLRDRDDAGRP
jgi:hypothetical protein